MTSRTPDSPAPALGWLLLVPAVLGMLITLLLPTIQTIGFSLRSGGLIGPSEFTGPDNYARLLTDDSFWPALGFTLSVTAMPLLVALVVAPLLAFALDRGGSWVRRAGRVLLTLSPVAFSPVAVAVSWLRGLAPDAGGPAAMAGSLTAPETAPGTLRLIVAAATFGVVCALAVMAFLPALRGGAPVPAMLAVAGVVALATVAAGLQFFTIGLLLTGGGPLDSTQTPALLQYTFTWRMARLGVGGALATITGAVLGVLGVAAVILAVASRMRLTVTPKPGTRPAAADPHAQIHPSGAVPPARGPAQHAHGSASYGETPGSQGPGFHEAGPYGRESGSREAGPYGREPGSHGAGPYGGDPGSGEAGPYGGQAGSRAPGAYGGPVPGDAPGGAGVSGAGVAAGVVALVVFAAVALLAGWPRLSALFAAGEAAARPNVHLNTWLPAFVGALVSVGVAYLGALGIGALRPLGPRSEWLLLPFAPWLFVGTGPLSIANWNTMRGLGLIDTFAVLVPPLLVSVPALVILTLLCRGLAERNPGDLLSGVVGPSLPMAGILVLAVTVVNAQDLLWPLLVVQEPGLATAPLAQFLATNQFAGGAVDVGLATPLLVIVPVLAAAVAAQVLYLDRLALTVGAESGSRRPPRGA